VLFEYGINHIDTAASYGESERRIGPWMKRYRDRFFLATKTEERTRQGARESLLSSLDLLQTDHVDLFQIHNLSTQAEWEIALGPGGALEAFIEARQQGSTLSDGGSHEDARPRRRRPARGGPPRGSGAPARRRGHRGTITYLEGTVEIVRDGEALDANIVKEGLGLANFDLMKVGGDGEVEARITSPTAPATTLRIGPGTQFSLEIGKVGTRQQTTVGLIIGCVTVKTESSPAARA